jgi:hypothetical protein
VLILEHLALISIHRFTQPVCRFKDFHVSRRRQHGRGAGAALTRRERLVEATIHVAWMQAGRIGGGVSV